MRRVPNRISVLSWPFLIVISTAFVAHIGCKTTVRSVTREAKPLAYVGQVQFGKPTNEADQVVVPLKYVGGDWSHNSAIVPIAVDSTVSNSEIELTVVTAVATGDDTKKGYKLILPEDSKGKYAVYYRDPNGPRHQIGTVRIEE